MELIFKYNNGNTVQEHQQPVGDNSAEASAPLDEVVGINKGVTTLLYTPAQQGSTSSQGQEFTGPSNASSSAVIQSRATATSRQSLSKKSRSSSVSTGMYLCLPKLQ